MPTAHRIGKGVSPLVPAYVCPTGIKQVDEIAAYLEYDVLWYFIERVQLAELQSVLVSEFRMLHCSPVLMPDTKIIHFRDSRVRRAPRNKSGGDILPAAVFRATLSPQYL